MADYYVSRLGDDGNAGTSEALPWKTLSHVNDQTFSAGDNIYLRRGDEWRDVIVVPSSGSAGSPITYGAYGSGADPVVRHKNSYRYNHRNTAEYVSDGVGHSVQSGAGWARNGDFEFYTGNDFDHWSEVTTGSSAVQVNTSDGFPVADLTALGGYAQISATFYFSANQRFEITIEGKSDGTATARPRFYIAAGGLQNTETNGVYSTWGSSDWIDGLEFEATDTDWTTKKIIIEADSSDRNCGFEFRSEVSASLFKVRRVYCRPIWKVYSGDTYMASYEANQSVSFSMIAVDGVVKAPAADKDSVDATNPYALEDSGAPGGTHNKIFYYYSPDGNPSTINTDIDTVPVATGIHVLDGNDKNYVTFENIDFRYGQSVLDNFGTNVTLNNCTVSGGPYCVFIDAANFTADGCVFQYGNWTVRGQSGANDALIKNCVVRYARYNFADGVSGEEGGGIAFTADGGTDIDGVIVENCDIYDCDRYGIAAWGELDRLKDHIYRYNRIHDVLQGFFHQALDDGSITGLFYYNLIYDPKAADSTYTQFDLPEDNPGVGAVPSQGIRHYRGNGMKYYNNTVVGFDYGFVATINPDEFEFKNNLLIDCGQRFVFGATIGVGASISNNLYYNTTAPTRDGWEWSGTEYSTFSAWQSANEASAVGSDPLLQSVSGEDFSLSVKSPAIDAGVDVGLTRDFGGRAINSLPDIGAYESARFIGSSAGVMTSGASALEIMVHRPEASTLEGLQKIHAKVQSDLMKASRK